ncbi:hypothetical protein FQA39_LY07189 [Lamprigera yunnana]|nr:hypothetical protein FQA39_LY07189 [Lamprigera yunnana]
MMESTSGGHSSNPSTAGKHLNVVENVPAKLYCSDSMEVIKIRIVFGRNDLNPKCIQRCFRPTMVHQVFPPEGIIYGYRNLSIDIYFLANSSKCFVDVHYAHVSNVNKLAQAHPDNILLKLTPWLPEDFYTDKKDFLEALGKEKHHKSYGTELDSFELYNEKEDTTYKYTINLCSTEEPGFSEFHSRFQCMIVWFIDAASQIDVEDPNWMFFYVYETRESPSSSTSGTYPVGFGTTYKFFHFPDKIRIRISQFFIIPPCQGIGLGTFLLKNIYKVIIDMPNVIDITVEDPCPEFTRLRDFLDCQLLMNLNSFQESNINNGSLNDLFIEANSHYKFNRKQFRRAYEILRFSYIKCNRFSSEYAALYNETRQRAKASYPKPSVENIAAAEIYKSKGNDLMRNGLYREALDQYTRAIELNPENAVYYCNRAAAYSRLENHESVIEDCECAVRLDPTYGKAYGRLGIAYSNLNMFKKAHEAYFQALKMDPTNSMYQENFKLAEERLEADSIPKEPNLDLNQFMGNPTLMNMASQMLNDPGVRDVMSGILQMGNDGGNPSIDALLSMGQQLADQMQINNPSFVANLRRQFSGSRPPNNTDGNNSNCEDESMGNIPRPNDTNDPSV